MNKVKIELEVTPDQLADIASVLRGAPVVDLTRESEHISDVERDLLLNEVSEGGTMIPKPPVDAPIAMQPEANAANVGQPDDGTDTAAPPPPSTDVPLGKGVNGQMIPWDARIHGKAKKLNADDTWRLAQGVDRETLVPQVEAELVAALAAQPAATTDAGNTPPPPPASGPTTFAELLPLVTSAKAAGTLSDEQIASACTELGLATFGLIATRPDLIPKAAELLGV